MKRQPKPVIDYTTWTRAQFEEKLETDPKYQDYFEYYEPKSVKKFIKDYAAGMVGTFSRLAAIRTAYEEHQTLFLTLADEIIDAVLQKKLFNLQCLWRAGKLDLPIVKVTSDFQYFERHIRACPFIEPVTPAEIDLATRFLNEYRWDEFQKNAEWQDYDRIKDIIENKEVDNPEYPRYPPLYAFFDTYQDTAFLAKLPDLRYEKERYYSDIYWKAREEAARKLREQNGEPEPATDRDERPYLHYSTENRKKFCALYESDEMQEAFRLSDQRANYFQNKWDLDDALSLMARTQFAIPMLANADWKKAIIESARVYKQDQIVAFLPDAYEIYMMEFDDEDLEKAIEQRVAVYDTKDLIENDHSHGWRTNRIIEARVLLGEPADLNYFSL